MTLGSGDAQVVNLYHIYQALEEALEANAEHPLVESLHFPAPQQRERCNGGGGIRRRSGQQ